MSDTKALIYKRNFFFRPLYCGGLCDLISSGRDRRRIAQLTGCERSAVTRFTVRPSGSRLCHLPIAESGYVSETGSPIRANPLKGGDAKPPVYGREPTIAGLPNCSGRAHPPAASVATDYRCNPRLRNIHAKDAPAGPPGGGPEPRWRQKPCTEALRHQGEYPGLRPSLQPHCGLPPVPPAALTTVRRTRAPPLRPRVDRPRTIHPPSAAIRLPRSRWAKAIHSGQTRPTLTATRSPFRCRTSRPGQISTRPAGS